MLRESIETMLTCMHIWLQPFLQKACKPVYISLVPRHHHMQCCFITTQGVYSLQQKFSGKLASPVSDIPSNFPSNEGRGLIAAGATTLPRKGGSNDFHDMQHGCVLHEGAQLRQQQQQAGRGSGSARWFC